MLKNNSFNRNSLNAQLLCKILIINLNFIYKAIISANLLST